MLVHHADALCNGHRWGRQVHSFPVYDDFAFGGLFQAEEHLHQGGFPRAVLAHQRMDFAPAHVKVNALVCGNAVGVYLGDPLHLHNVFALRHWLCLLLF